MYHNGTSIFIVTSSLKIRSNSRWAGNKMVRCTLCTLNGFIVHIAFWALWLFPQLSADRYFPWKVESAEEPVYFHNSRALPLLCSNKNRPKWAIYAISFTRRWRTSPGGLTFFALERPSFLERPSLLLSLLPSLQPSLQVPSLLLSLLPSWLVPS